MNNSIEKDIEILIADTDNATLEDISSTLNKVQPHWHLSVTNSGKQCLDILKNGNCPDVIILGMQLSDMTGFELTGLIRDDSDGLVIILSDDKDMDLLLKAFDVGVNDYIVKPFNKTIFVTRLKALIRRRLDVQIRGAKLGGWR
jgi:two-component system, OmpR family, response regulator VicR